MNWNIKNTLVKKCMIKDHEYLFVFQSEYIISKSIFLYSFSASVNKPSHQCSRISDK